MPLKLLRSRLPGASASPKCHYYRVTSDQGQGDGNSDNPRCLTNVYKAGDAFIERPGEVLNAKNTPDVEALVYATFPGLQKNQLARTDEPKPNPDPCLRFGV